MLATHWLPDDLSDDEIRALLLAVPSRGGASLEGVTRNMSFPLSTEIVVEAEEDPVAFGRLLQAKLGRPVAVSASWPYGWLLIDPERGEWIVDYEPGDDGFVLCEPYVEPAALPPHSHGSASRGLAPLLQRHRGTWS